MIEFIVGFITAYIFEAAILWWGWKYSEKEDTKRTRERLDPAWGRERFREDV